MEANAEVCFKGLHNPPMLFNYSVFERISSVSFSSWQVVVYLCVSHNVRTLLHTDSGNEQNSFNRTLSLGNFAGGEVWISPALDDQAQLGPAPAASATREFPLTSEVLGQAPDTWENPTTFPCSALHCTLPWQGNRWAQVGANRLHMTSQHCFRLDSHSQLAPHSPPRP